MKNSLVSVIITTKNSSRTLKTCLESIKKQSYENIELIVIDNDSTDNTKDIAKEFTDKVYDFGPERSAQRNYGATQAKGEFLLIHDSDIYFDIDSVKECVEISEKEICDAIILPEKSIGEGFWSKVKGFERNLYVGNDLIEAPRYFRSKSYENIGGYDEELTGGEDWDLGIRFREKGYVISRASIFLKHDEGRLNLLGSSKKRIYYAGSILGKYAEKHPQEFKKQMSFFVRFPINKILKQGFRHPILLSCMIIMKTFEFGFGEIGYLFKYKI